MLPPKRSAPGYPSVPTAAGLSVCNALSLCPLQTGGGNILKEGDAREKAQFVYNILKERKVLYFRSQQ